MTKSKSLVKDLNWSLKVPIPLRSMACFWKSQTMKKAGRSERHLLWHSCRMFLAEIMEMGDTVSNCITHGILSSTPVAFSWLSARKVVRSSYSASLKVSFFCRFLSWNNRFSNLMFSNLMKLWCHVACRSAVMNPVMFSPTLDSSCRRCAGKSSLKSEARSGPSKVCWWCQRLTLQSALEPRVILGHIKACFPARDEEHGPLHLRVSHSIHL